MYEPRTYRQWVSDRDLVSFRSTVQETDMLIRATRDLSSKALSAIKKYRSEVEKYIDSHPVFALALEPLTVERLAPSIIREMAESAALAGVGPMAAVAGAMAERVGMELLRSSDEVIVENGGDIFMKIRSKRMMGVYAGESPLTGKIAFEIRPEETPLGVCTSSGSVGHSLSFGKADAVVVMSRSAALADAAATAICNRVQCATDISPALGFARGIRGLLGVAIIFGDHMGLSGQIRLADLDKEDTAT